MSVRYGGFDLVTFRSGRRRAEKRGLDSAWLEVSGPMESKGKLSGHSEHSRTAICGYEGSINESTSVAA